ncbi:MAG: flagellar motor switch protein FliN [Plesiomonas sp.]|uniref:flagellar motor switch protein FliN n=1 Tax=Plesiomonas sp. TaxID=2486279 RepID=UPI003F403616
MSDVTTGQEMLAEQWANEVGDEGDIDSSIKRAELEELRDDSVILSASERKRLDSILDIPVTISMEVGRSQISIRNLLQLNQGSVVELERIAGEPLDVMVNGTLIAHGEVVVVNDKFGIRLTDVISQTERIKKLK